MSSSGELLEMSLLLIQADNLAAKDHNILGRPTTSDPYCIVRFWPLGEHSVGGGKDRTIFLGKTPPVMKTLCPQFGQSFETSLPLHELTEEMFFEVTIMDYDKIGTDDPMGTVQVNVPIRDLGTTTKWYGIPADSAGGELATGRIQCTLTTKLVAPTAVQQKQEVERETASVGALLDGSDNKDGHSNSQDNDDEDDDGPVITRKPRPNKASAIRERADRRHAGRRGHESAEQRRQSRKERDSILTNGDRGTTATGRPRSRVRKTKSLNEETSSSDAAQTAGIRPRSRVRQTKSVNDQTNNESGKVVTSSRPRSRVRRTKSVNDETSGSKDRPRSRNVLESRTSPRDRKVSPRSSSERAKTKASSARSRKEGKQESRSPNEPKLQ